MVDKQNSNSTGLAIAQEVIGSPKTLPGTPEWYGQEPNSYSDFGANISTVAREPISADRQRNKGTVTDLEAAGGYNTDITQNNLTRLMQGFVFANAREKADNLPLNGTAIPLTITDSGTSQYRATSGLTIFTTGSLLFASGFGVAANNGLKRATTVATGAITVAETVVSEASVPAAARIQTCGFEFASGDATLTLTAGVLTLGATAKNLTTLGLNIGEWVFIGGDVTGNAFNIGKGYARVATIAAGAITFDKVTNSTFATDAGTGKTIRIFFGKFLRNEATEADIITRTYNVERTLGNDGVGVQSEYLLGAIANEFTLNIPVADKMAADLSFVAMSYETRTGTQGVKSGTRIPGAAEAPFNTSSNVYRIKMNILDPLTLAPTPLFGFVSEAEVSINNNASLAKAVGVLGGIGITVGNFEVGGSITAYFSTVAGVEAVRNNADVTLDIIMAKSNAGIVYDIPLLTLGNARLNVVKDQSIEIPLDTLAAKGAAGYTLGITNFPYLPTAAMPV